MAVDGEKMKALCVFEMSGNACPATECCTAVDLCVQQHHCESLIDVSHNLKIVLASAKCMFLKFVRART